MNQACHTMRSPAQNDGGWIELAATMDQTRIARDRFVRAGDSAAVAA